MACQSLILSSLTSLFLSDLCADVCLLQHITMVQPNDLKYADSININISSFI